MESYAESGTTTSGSLTGIFAYTEQDAGSLGDVTAAKIESNAYSSATNLIGLYVSTDGCCGVSNDYGIYITDGGSGTNNWGLYENSADPNYFRGKVGIGSTTPSNALTVSGTGGVSVDLAVNGRIQSGDGSNSGGMWVNSSDTMFVGAASSNTIGFWNNGSWALNVTSTGSVGIGTTTPGSLLEVNGTTHLDSTTTISGALNTTATVNLDAAVNATALASGTVAAGKYLGLNASNQVVLGTAGVGAGIALNGITAATGSNTIDNAANAQTWTWNSLSTGTAFTISSNSMTTGSLLSLQDTAAAATSTGEVLSISDITTGAGFGVYTAMTGFGNTGYAGYFTNTSTGALNYGLYASTSSASGWAGYFQGPVNVAGNITVTSCTGCSAAGSNALSSLTSATTTNSIDSTNMAQTWKWGALRPRRH